MITFFSLTAHSQIKDSIKISEIYNNALNSHEAYSNLEDMQSQAAPRAIDSEQAQTAINLLTSKLEKLDCDTVYLQDYTVDSWHHLYSFAELTVAENKTIKLHVKALGPSVSTPLEGLNAEMIEVNDLQALKALKKKEVKGKIVFFNTIMDNSFIEPVDAYVFAVQSRLFGADEAAKKGAIAVVVRSISTITDDFVHTGCLRYSNDAKKIPAVAISTNDADYLSSVLAENQNIKLHLKVRTGQKMNYPTHNIIAEIKGNEYMDEVITIGAHIDTWYNTSGAHDDGAGCVQMIDVLRIFNELKINNKRTIRLILFMDEEIFTSGATAYVSQHQNPNEKFIAAIESDLGGFEPSGFFIDGGNKEFSKIQCWKSLLEPYGLVDLEKGFGGGDMLKLKQQFGLTSIALKVNSQRYFEIIHTEKDSFETLNRRELQLGTAAICSLVYLLDKYGL